MEQSVVFGNRAVVRFGSHMFQKSGETADDLLPIQFFCRAAVFFRSQPFPCGTEGPGIFHHFLRPELFLDGEEHLPFQFGERNGFRFLHGSRFRGFSPGLSPLRRMCPTPSAKTPRAGSRT